MATPKVMIFESDAAFADALKQAFSRRGCTVRIVDDGQIGLDLAPTDPPDLIIVAVELPRMSGFAVCNKLKKLNELKDIPVVITSSESSQETFEHHSKLRTRAEDYVHKPIDADELIRRCAAHVTIPDVALVDSEEVSIDDLEAVPIGEDSMLLENTATSEAVTDADLDAISEVSFDQLLSDVPVTAVSAAPVPIAAPVREASPVPQPMPTSASRLPSLLDDDLEDLTMVASSRALLADPQMAMRPAAKPAATPSAVPRPFSFTPPASATPSRAPTPSVSVVSPAITAENERMKKRIEELESEMTIVRAEGRRSTELTEENTRLRKHADDVQRLTRELDEMRARSLRPASATTTNSGREALDLRESLHKKDKELLQLRELANARDKELLQLRETLLQRDLEKADLDERIIAKERELADLSDRHAGLAQDHEGVTSDLATSRKTEATLRGELATAHESHKVASERAASEKDASDKTYIEEVRVLKDTQDKTLTALRNEHAKNLTARQEAHDTEAASRKSEYEAAVKALRDAAEQAASQHAQEFATAKTTHESAVTDLNAVHESTLTHLKATHESTFADLKTAHEKYTTDTKTAHESAVATLIDTHESTVTNLTTGHESAVVELKSVHEKNMADTLAAHEQHNQDRTTAHTTAVATLEAMLTGERNSLAAEKAARAEEVQSLTRKHDSSFATLTSEHNTLRSELEGKIEGLTADLDHARRMAARNASLLERARRAALIAAGLVEETTTPLEGHVSETALGNAE
jgi:CheY-like chemotaxis protein